MFNYYCYECDRQCSTIPIDNEFPFEFWGQSGFSKETYLMCEQCGGYQVEEKDITR